jgi:predicted nucleotidyltransferase
MNLSSGISSVIPGVRGAVLEVLGRTSEPLSGRSVAELVGEKASVKGVYLVLRSLAAEGIIDAKESPSAIFYQLNRDHLAAESIVGLANLRGRLIDAIESSVASWPVPVYGAWIFGSFARGTAGPQSDIDILVVRPDGTAIDDNHWRMQLRDAAHTITRWSGNDCRIIEFSREEFSQLFENNDRLARELRSDALALTARRLPVRTSVKSGSR